MVCNDIPLGQCHFDVSWRAAPWNWSRRVAVLVQCWMMLRTRPSRRQGRWEGSGRVRELNCSAARRKSGWEGKRKKKERGMERNESERQSGIQIVVHVQNRKARRERVSEEHSSCQLDAGLPYPYRQPHVMTTTLFPVNISVNVTYKMAYE